MGEIVVSLAQQAGAPQGQSAESEADRGAAVAGAGVQDPASNEQVLEDVVLEGAVPQEEEVILEDPAALPAPQGRKKQGRRQRLRKWPRHRRRQTSRLTAAKVPLPTAAEFVATVEAVLTSHPQIVAAPSAGSGETVSSTDAKASGTLPVTSETAVAAVPAAEKVVAAAPVTSSSSSTSSSPVQPTPANTDVPVKKSLLFWSAAVNPADAAKADDADQSHVPPVLRSLQQCQACGFPVSAGRSLCVECEEKKWRGQLKVPQAARAIPPVASGSRKAEGPVLAAKVPAGAPNIAAANTAAPAPLATSASAGATGETGPTEGKDLNVGVPAAASGGSPVGSTGLQGSAQSASVQTPDAEVTSTANFVLSAGLEPSQSWLAANKYIIAVLVAVAVLVAGFFLLR